MDHDGHLILDIEIKNRVEDIPGGWDSTDMLGVSCAVVYSYRRDRYRIFGDSDRELDTLREALLNPQTTRITGFNSWKFDLACICSASKSDWSDSADGQIAAWREELRPKSDDLLRRIWTATGAGCDGAFTDAHKGYGLAAVCEATIGRGKIGHGEEAPKLYQAGHHGQLHNYCVDDVALTRELSEFVDRYGYVIDPKTGAKLMLPDWRETQGAAV